MSSRKSLKSKAKTKSSDDGVLLKRLPMLVLEDAVLFPHNMLPVGSLEEQVSASEMRTAANGSLRVAVVSRDADGVFAPVGVEGFISGLLKLPNGATGAIVCAERRIQVKKVHKRHRGFALDASILEEAPVRKTSKLLASLKALKASALKILAAQAAVAEETKAKIARSENVTELCALVVPHLSLTTEEKLSLLSTPDPRRMLKRVLAFLARESELEKLTKDIHAEVTGDLHETHRRYYLREQIKAIKRELGEMEGGATEVDQLEEQLDKLALPKIVREAADEEIERMGVSGVGSPEYIISHSYVSLLRDLPWSQKLGKNPSLKMAQQNLSKDHFGLHKAKDKILEYLAVMLHRRAPMGQILLLTGPPGVGKTSLAKSIANSLGRPFARIALGGVRDESEIRGHRRTYIGAMPGKLVQAVKQTKSRYPVILLDEIDKVGRDQQGGDVAAALLEVLDPEQNQHFVDHYLAVPFDLSGVLFIATANTVDSIPEPLLDRMEPVTISSYTESEKMEIAKRHLVPEIRQSLGLLAGQFRVDRLVVTKIIREYTREAGVRQLKRELMTIGRRFVRLIVEKRSQPKIVSTANLTRWLGPPKFLPEPNDTSLSPGVAIGLAYTDVGGEILFIEARSARSSQLGCQLRLTGSVGKIMRESAETCLAFLQANIRELGLGLDVFENVTFHVHLPDGGTPKDGPSAGVAILCALASQLLGRPLPTQLAMTGEITLRGQVLAVGGIREKVLAAHRYGKRRVIVPQANQSDLADVPRDVLDELDIVFVGSMLDVLAHVGLKDWSPASELPTFGVQGQLFC